MTNAAPAKKRPTPERLIRAALDLFQSRGYHAVGLAEILDRAGCPKGSLYHHFPGGKAALAEGVIDWLESTMVAYFETERDAATPAAKQIARLFDGTAEWISETKFSAGALLAVMAQEVVPQDALLTERIGLAQRRAINAFGAALAAGGGEAALAGPVLAMLDGAVAQARGQLSTAPIVAARDVAARLLN